MINEASLYAMRRELNEIEYLNWCFGQPYNIVISIRIRGNIPPDRLQSALDKAQQRHPLLKVNTILDEQEMPWFVSEGVGAIPLKVVDRAGEDHALRLTEKELAAPFDMNKSLESPLPLMRVTLLRPQNPATEPADIIINAQHTITDGMSMVFLVRDLLYFMTNPKHPVTVQDVTASSEDIFPPKVRKRIPKSDLRFKTSLLFMKLYLKLKFRRGIQKPRTFAPSTKIHSWELTADQTEDLLARCKQEQVSVQSALCTAFLTTFTAVNTPVNLRPQLALPIGEAFGLYAGAAVIKMKYDAKADFWDNARKFHGKLRKSLRNPFSVFRLFSKRVPLKAIQEYFRLLADLVSDQHPFAITNLGSFDKMGIRFQVGDLHVESFFGSVSEIIDASVLTVYTIDEVMHFHFHYMEHVMNTSEAEKLVSKAMNMLRTATEQRVK
jgi:NRPS condensation-like uncharacterized protein